MSSELRNDEVGIYLARELETILARTYEVEYSDIVYSRLLPVSQEVAETAESYTYRIFDAQGSMKIIQDKASDLPRSDVLRKEVTAKVATIGGSFAYTVAEARAAATIPGMNLEQRRANAVRRSAEERFRRLHSSAIQVSASTVSSIRAKLTRWCPTSGLPTPLQPPTK